MGTLWVTPAELESESESPYAYEACRTASFILWAFSGRKYTGTRTVTERYDCACRASSSIRQMRDPGLFPVDPYLLNGNVYNALNGRCSCPGTVAGRHAKVRLRGHPVRAVQRVVAGGRTLDQGEYQIVNSSVLTAAPGASFDMCGVEITYTYGAEPPTAGKRAARHLARELTKGWSGEECDLPERTTSVSRQGVSLTIIDQQEFLDDLRTGVYAVDLFLRAVNPDRARKPARVFSPDIPRPTRVTVNASAPIGPYDLSITPGEPYVWSVNLAEIGAGILTDPTWSPSAQLSAWNGATVLNAEEDRFTVDGSTLSVELTAEETGTMSLGGSGVWDLYAVNIIDNVSVVHVLTSNVRLQSSQ